ncbi:ATP-binding protein [Nonomuraea sp. NPDC050556]|uniref:ATP-binding protein n=1 Tax=Nonomuraea sp. NPDC050556 TaxID=3364369 RepID=UPI00379D91A7
MVAVLPLEPNVFVGREADITELTRLVVAGRVTTLCGTGGIGKSRLAVRVARELAPQFADGVYLVELAELASAHHFAERVASTLGLQSDTLMPSLRASNSLILLDNCEHLIEPAANLCTEIVTTCPDVRVLATSRESLRVPGETVWRMQPLGIRDEATRLFRERARRDINPLHDERIGEICAALDGIPLAIELAAAMTRVLSVDQIGDRLADRFTLLNGGDRTVPPRQRSLSATIGWSHRLLDVRERLLLRRLAVFTGVWTLGLAESVCSGPDLAPEEVLPLLTELVDKSLVLTVGEVAGESTYRMLETVRQFVTQEPLDPALHRRHLDAVEELVAAGVAVLLSPTPGYWPMLAAWANLGEALFADLFAALLRAPELGRTAQGLQILWSLRWMLATQGRWEESARHIDLLLPSIEDAPTRLVGEVTAMRGLLGLLLGRSEEGAAFMRRAITMCRASGSTPGEALALAGLASLGAQDADFTQAYTLAKLTSGDDPFLPSYVHYLHARTLQAAGRLHEAELIYQEEGAAWLGINDQVSAWVATGLAEVAHARGELSAAYNHYAEALDYYRYTESDEPRLPAVIGLGTVALDRGDHQAARRWLTQGLRKCERLSLRRYATQLLEAFAGLESAVGAHQRAVRLAGASGAQQSARIQKVLERAKAAIGEAQAAHLWREGAAMSLGAAIECAVAALQETPAAPPPAAAPADPPPTLTAREREIAKLVARGLSNRAIADELVISPATSARHVANILAKLSFSSRAQIAVWATEVFKDH